MPILVPNTGEVIALSLLLRDTAIPAPPRQ